MFSTAIAAITLFAAGISAAPTATNAQHPTRTYLTGVTHSVVAGLGGLRFDPDNVVAEIGDIVEWHYLPKNHSVVQSDFAHPCEPLAGGNGFNSGFNFATTEGQSANVFQIVVQDTKPIWYYCAQTVGNHCQNGMTGVINQNFDDQTKSLRAHKELAAQTTVSIPAPVVQGGNVIPNPNPLRGF